MSSLGLDVLSDIFNGTEDEKRMVKLLRERAEEKKRFEASRTGKIILKKLQKLKGTDGLLPHERKGVQTRSTDFRYQAAGMLHFVLPKHRLDKKRQKKLDMFARLRIRETFTSDFVKVYTQYVWPYLLPMSSWVVMVNGDYDSFSTTQYTFAIKVRFFNRGDPKMGFGPRYSPSFRTYTQLRKWLNSKAYKAWFQRHFDDSGGKTAGVGSNLVYDGWSSVGISVDMVFNPFVPARGGCEMSSEGKLIFPLRDTEGKVELIQSKPIKNAALRMFVHETKDCGIDAIFEAFRLHLASLKKNAPTIPVSIQDLKKRIKCHQDQRRRNATKSWNTWLRNDLEIKGKSISREEATKRWKDEIVNLGYTPLRKRLDIFHNDPLSTDELVKVATCFGAELRAYEYDSTRGDIHLVTRSEYEKGDPLWICEVVLYNRHWYTMKEESKKKLRPVCPVHLCKNRAKKNKKFCGPHIQSRREYLDGCKIAKELRKVKDAGKLSHQFMTEGECDILFARMDKEYIDAQEKGHETGFLGIAPADRDELRKILVDGVKENPHTMFSRRWVEKNITYSEEIMDTLCSVLGRVESFEFQRKEALIIQEAMESIKDLNLDPSQREAFEATLSGRNTYHNGPAGSGKTYVGKLLIPFLKRLYPGVRVVAFQARHAKEMDEAGITIARALGDGSPVTTPTQKEFESVEFLIVAECHANTTALLRLDRRLRTIKRKNRPFGGVKYFLSGHHIQLDMGNGHKNDSYYLHSNPLFVEMQSGEHPMKICFYKEQHRIKCPKLLKLTKGLMSLKDRWSSELDKILQSRCRRLVDFSVKDLKEMEFISWKNATKDGVYEFLYEKEEVKKSGAQHFVAEVKEEKGKKPEKTQRSVVRKQMWLKKGERVMVTKNMDAVLYTEVSERPRERLYLHGEEKEEIKGLLEEVKDSTITGIRLCNGEEYIFLKEVELRGKKVLLLKDEDTEKVYILKKVTSAGLRGYPCEPMRILTVHKAQGKTITNKLGILCPSDFKSIPAHLMYVAWTRLTKFEDGFLVFYDPKNTEKDWEFSTMSFREMANIEKHTHDFEVYLRNGDYEDIFLSSRTDPHFIPRAGQRMKWLFVDDKKKYRLLPECCKDAKHEVKEEKKTPAKRKRKRKRMSAEEKEAEKEAEKMQYHKEHKWCTDVMYCTIFGYWDTKTLTRNVSHVYIRASHQEKEFKGLNTAAKYLMDICRKRSNPTGKSTKLKKLDGHAITLVVSGDSSVHGFRLSDWATYFLGYKEMSKDFQVLTPQGLRSNVMEVKSEHTGNICLRLVDITQYDPSFSLEMLYTVASSPQEKCKAASKFLEARMYELDSLTKECQALSPMFDETQVMDPEEKKRVDDSKKSIINFSSARSTSKYLWATHMNRDDTLHSGLTGETTRGMSFNIAKLTNKWESFEAIGYRQPLTTMGTDFYESPTLKGLCGAEFEENKSKVKSLCDKLIGNGDYCRLLDVNSMYLAVAAQEWSWFPIKDFKVLQEGTDVTNAIQKWCQMVPCLNKSPKLEEYMDSSKVFYESVSKACGELRNLPGDFSVKVVVTPRSDTKHPPVPHLQSMEVLNDEFPVLEPDGRCFSGVTTYDLKPHVAYLPKHQIYLWKIRGAKVELATPVQGVYWGSKAKIFKPYFDCLTSKAEQLKKEKKKKSRRFVKALGVTLAGGLALRAERRKTEIVWSFEERAQFFQPSFPGYVLSCEVVGLNDRGRKLSARQLETMQQAYVKWSAGGYEGKVPPKPKRCGFLIEYVLPRDEFDWETKRSGSLTYLASRITSYAMAYWCFVEDVIGHDMVQLHRHIDSVCLPITGAKKMEKAGLLHPTQPLKFSEDISCDCKADTPVMVIAQKFIRPGRGAFMWMCPSCRKIDFKWKLSSVGKWVYDPYLKRKRPIRWKDLFCEEDVVTSTETSLTRSSKTSVQLHKQHAQDVQYTSKKRNMNMSEWTGREVFKRARFEKQGFQQIRVPRGYKPRSKCTQEKKAKFNTVDDMIDTIPVPPPDSTDEEEFAYLASLSATPITRTKRKRPDASAHHHVTKRLEF